MNAGFEEILELWLRHAVCRLPFLFGFNPPSPSYPPADPDRASWLAPRRGHPPGESGDV
jgi:hypothetical protein